MLNNLSHLIAGLETCKSHLSFILHELIFSLQILLISRDEHGYQVMMNKVKKEKFVLVS